MVIPNPTLRRAQAAPLRKQLAALLAACRAAFAAAPAAVSPSLEPLACVPLCGALPAPQRLPASLTLAQARPRAARGGVLENGTRCIQCSAPGETRDTGRLAVAWQDAGRAGLNDGRIPARSRRTSWLGLGKLPGPRSGAGHTVCGAAGEDAMRMHAFHAFHTAFVEPECRMAQPAWPQSASGHCSTAPSRQARTPGALRRACRAAGRPPGGACSWRSRCRPAAAPARPHAPARRSSCCAWARARPAACRRAAPRLRWGWQRTTRGAAPRRKAERCL